MKTDLPVGAFIIFRHRGMPELWQVLDTEMRDEKMLGVVARPLVPGDVVHRCVWKDAELAPRNKHTIRPGDVTYEKLHHISSGTFLTHYNSFTKQAPKWTWEGNY